MVCILCTDNGKKVEEKKLTVLPNVGIEDKI